MSSMCSSSPSWSMNWSYEMPSWTLETRRFSWLPATVSCRSINVTILKRFEAQEQLWIAKQETSKKKTRRTFTQDAQRLSSPPQHPCIPLLRTLTLHSAQPRCFDTRSLKLSLARAYPVESHVRQLGVLLASQRYSRPRSIDALPLWTPC